MDLEKLLTKAQEDNASDIFLVAGMAPAFKIDGSIIPQSDDKCTPDDLKDMISHIYELAGNRSYEHIEEDWDDDFSFSIRGVARFRANIFKQRGTLAAVLRIVRFDLPDESELHIPQIVTDVAKMKDGLVLVTGPAGSGKSTTMACIVKEINKNRNLHIVTLEDPIEYLHRHDKSIVTQREVGIDTKSYYAGLRAALREAPDVIQLGEMRDHETIKTAMTAAETGHLIISTLHTRGASGTISRLIDSFPPDQQSQIRLQISMVLKMVISQQLVTTIDGKLRAVFEVMVVDSAIENLIAQNKINQIDNNIASGRDKGMILMEDSLVSLVKEGVITKEVALASVIKDREAALATKLKTV